TTRRAVLRPADYGPRRLEAHSDLLLLPTPLRPPPGTPLRPCTALFRSGHERAHVDPSGDAGERLNPTRARCGADRPGGGRAGGRRGRGEAGGGVRGDFPPPLVEWR